MKRKAACGLPILVFLVVLGLALAATSASAQYDDKSNKPSDGSGGPLPEDHGGGDPDNPVPVDGSGGGNESLQSGGMQASPLYVGDGEKSLAGDDLLLLWSTITGVLGSVLFL